MKPKDEKKFLVLMERRKKYRVKIKAIEEKLNKLMEV